MVYVIEKFRNLSFRKPWSKIWPNCTMIVCSSPWFCFDFYSFPSPASFPILRPKISRGYIFVTANNHCEKVCSWLFQEKSSKSHWLGLSHIYTQQLTLARRGILSFSWSLITALPLENGKVLLEPLGLPKRLSVSLQRCWDNKKLQTSSK